MTTTVRSLLTQGNGKVGESIHLWSIPAVETCPGRSPVCERFCYARQGRFLFPAVEERLRWNYEQSLLDTFAERMAKEVKRKGCLVVRVHCSGDFYSAAYAEKWLGVMRRCPKARFYFYTRSWRVPEVAPVLEEMAALKCCRAWYSVDSHTGVPDRVPPGVRIAYLQVDDEDQPELVNLMFRVRRLRRRRIALSLVCPSETPLGKDRQVNCGSCGKCWR